MPCCMHALLFLHNSRTSTKVSPPPCSIRPARLRSQQVLRLTLPVPRHHRTPHRSDGPTKSAFATGVLTAHTSVSPRPDTPLQPPGAHETGSVHCCYLPLLPSPAPAAAAALASKGSSPASLTSAPCVADIAVQCLTRAVALSFSTKEAGTIQALLLADGQRTRLLSCSLTCRSAAPAFCAVRCSSLIVCGR